jgi:ubiquinone/menaquinone biosynthesis C-methylase UbiE
VNRQPGYYDQYQRRLYDASGFLYDLLARRFFLIFGGSVGREFITDRGDFRAGHQVVSLGCGTGMQERSIAPRLSPGGAITGLDSGPSQIARAVKLNPHSHARFFVGDARDTKLAGGSFDRALLCFALHEMPEAVRAEVLAEARRLLKPDGRLVVAEHRIPDGKWMRRLQRVWWLNWLPGNTEKQTAGSLLRNTIPVELADAGFSVLARHAFPGDSIMEVVVAAKTAAE